MHPDIGQNPMRRCIIVLSENWNHSYLFWECCVLILANDVVVFD
jgi:hypothetical protein